MEECPLRHWKNSAGFGGISGQREVSGSLLRQIVKKRQGDHKFLRHFPARRPCSNAIGSFHAAALMGRL